MKKLIQQLFQLWLLLPATYAIADTHREVAVLDLTQANNEATTSELESVIHILTVSGIAHKVTTYASDAINYGAIVATSRLENYTLSSADEALIRSYVEAGGTLIAPSVNGSSLFDLFGISGRSVSDQRYNITFNLTSHDPAFRWLDDPKEQYISLGKRQTPAVINTFAYTLNGASPLAFYTDNSVAMTRFQFGKGTTYALGFSFKDLITRNQLNRDYEAQRSYSNDFEPTSDAVILFVKGILVDRMPFSVWKHTSPHNSSSALLITHDIDSRTAMDTMALFADYEKCLGLQSSYFITVHYTHDNWDRDFYTIRKPQMQYLLDKGHKLASHSVGHFVDFSNDVMVPRGNPGNTISNYFPAWDGTITTGATVYGELEVSKKQLDKDFKVNTVSFRPGFLTFNSRQIEVMEELGYKYSSSLSANDVLTNFPFRSKTDQSFGGRMSSIYELPVTISDVFRDFPINSGNYLLKVQDWLSVIRKNNANYAPTVFLSHPNRTWKLDAEKELVNQLPPGVKLMNFDDFGDFWRSRNEFEFSSAYQPEQNELIITVSDSALQANPAMSLVVDNGGALKRITVVTDEGRTVMTSMQDWDQNAKLVMLGNVHDGVQFTSPPGDSEKPELRVFPNPFTSSTYVEFRTVCGDKVDLGIYDLVGKRVGTLAKGELECGPHAIKWDGLDQRGNELANGIYMCRLCVDTKGCTEQKILISR